MPCQFKILLVIRGCQKGHKSGHSQACHRKRVSSSVQKMCKTPLGGPGTICVWWLHFYFHKWPCSFSGPAMVKNPKESKIRCKRGTPGHLTFQVPSPMCVLGSWNSFDSPKSIRYTKFVWLPMPIMMLPGLRSWWMKLWKWMYCRQWSWMQHILAHQLWPQKSNLLTSCPAKSKTVFIRNWKPEWTKKSLRDRLRQSSAITLKPDSVLNQRTEGMPVLPLSFL